MEPTSEGRAVASFLLAATGIANVAGYGQELYGRFWWFDRVLHACTILALTFWMALFVFHRALRGGNGRGALLVMLIASVGMAAGAIWEVAEWIFDRIPPGVIDIVMDSAGALLAGFASLAFLRPSEGTGSGEALR